MIDLQTIRHANPLPEVVGATVKLRRTGQEWKGCCPFHADRSPSFTIFANGQRFHCFGCGASGDVLDFVQRAHGVGLRDAARMLNQGDSSMPIIPAQPPAEQANRSRQARALWIQAIPVAGTLGEIYLRNRGIIPPYPADLGFARLPCDNLGALPCLVLAVRDLTGVVTGVQRIWLAPDGSGKASVANPKRSLGHIKGGAIRLGNPDLSGVLAVCEGPEDGLSLGIMLGGPVWASGGLSFLAAMQFPPEVHSIVIGADSDLQGREGAWLAAQAYAERGLAVRIIYPLEGFKDFNAELMGALA